MFDSARFFAAIRPYVGLTLQNVAGFDRVLAYANKLSPRLSLDKLGYVLATAYWESGRTMWPVKEAFHLSEAWRKRNLRYFPYYGRGLIQTTWKANYVKMGKLLAVDLVAKPELLLTWPIALPALFEGMERGLYTGKALGDFVDDKIESASEDLREYVAARKIVNGSDKAVTIGKLALTFEHALEEGGYEG